MPPLGRLDLFDIALRWLQSAQLFVFLNLKSPPFPAVGRWLQSVQLFVFLNLKSPPFPSLPWGRLGFRKKDPI